MGNGAGESKGTDTRWKRFTSQVVDDYGLVLVLLLVSYTVSMVVVADSFFLRLINNGLYFATLLLALIASRAPRIWIIYAIIFLLVSSGVISISLLQVPRPYLTAAVSFAGFFLLVITLSLILRNIASHKVVTTQTILGAICVYLLLGFAFSSLYQTIGYLIPEGFFGGTQRATTSEYLFFSFTTITTVGYGNLIPANNFGQALAMLEAIFGQVYLVIVVARLVSLWKVQEK